jgi:DNA-binding MarR family transcriptional regulator
MGHATKICGCAGTGKCLYDGSRNPGLLRSLAPMRERNPGFDNGATDVYTYTVGPETLEKHDVSALFDLPCACQNLRRVTRVVTRIYDQELRKAGIEITQFGLLTALAATGEANQKRLSAGFAMDSTTLTRTLALLLKQGLVRVRQGKDRRERLFRLTQEGKRQMAAAQGYWERAEQRLRRELGNEGWKSMKRMVSRITEAALVA